MNWFIEYNIIFFIVSVLAYGLMRNRGSHKLNRWVFLSLPLLFFGLSYVQPAFEQVQSLAVVTLPLVEISSDNQVQGSLFNYSLIAYIAGFCISILTLLLAVLSIIRLKKNAKQVEFENKTVHNCNTTASFFSIIFLNKDLSDKERSLAYAHEKAHVDQKHSIDRIFVSIVQTLLWFNPGIYLWKRMIIENHEYLADEAVLKYQDKKTYGGFLLNQEMRSHQPALHLTSNMSNLKSRIMKMNQRKKSVLFAYLVIPAMAIASLSFTFLTPGSERSEVIINQNAEDPVEDPDVFPSFDGGNEAMMSFLSKEIKYPKDAAEAKTEGKVYVSMVITSQGKVTKVEALRSPDESLSKEAKRVVNKMPDWNPGEKEGKKVNVKVVLPIMFKLNNK
jgi:TonB family protein